MQPPVSLPPPPPPAAASQVIEWRRFASALSPAAAAAHWPPPPGRAGCHGCIVRCPMGRDAAAYALAAAAAAAAPGATLWLYGRPAFVAAAARAAGSGPWGPLRAHPAAERGVAVATAVRVDGPAAADPPPLARVSIRLPGAAGPVRWRVGPGLFAGGRPDGMTGRLLSALVRRVGGLGPGAAVLDFGCGSGAIARGLAEARPDLEIHGFKPPPPPRPPAPTRKPPWSAQMQRSHAPVDCVRAQALGPGRAPTAD
jgi:16S rRNA G1207 methylase RsmC